MSLHEDERLQAELDLLHAMYPDHLQWNVKARQLKYAGGDGTLLLRLPDGYLTTQLPEVITAAVGRSDCRANMKHALKSCSVGEEILDYMISSFIEISEASVDHGDEVMSAANASVSKKATVIVWLHHLLNTNKRKQALAPAVEVNGVTKPGYPGVLVYSGLAQAVYEHVNELKSMNWQAFQVRYESEDEWTFTHGEGVKEVEAMKEVVAEIGEVNKQEFMEAMRIK